MRQSLCLAAALAVCFGGVQASHGQSLLDRLERTLTQPPRDALPPVTRTQTVPTRPALGVSVESVTDEVARQRGLAVRRGALITALAQGSPAERAGFPLGGVIVAVDGERIDSSRELVTAIRFARTDRPVEVSYFEGDRLYRKSLYLVPGVDVGPANAQPPTARNDAPEAPPADAGQPLPGRRASDRERPREPLAERPLLGRVAEMIDALAVPAGGEAPPPRPLPEADEVAQLRQQVERLTQQLEILQQRLSTLERQLAEQPDNR